MAGFHSKRSAYRASSAPDWPTIIIPVSEVQPPARNEGIRWFDEDRMLRVLKGICSDDVLPPIEVDEPQGHSSHRYRLRDGFHRFYASIAAGFSCLPVSVRPFFDITDPFA